MGLFDYLFKKTSKNITGEYFKLLDGYSPIFTTYDGGVYEMDLTRTAINCIATHCSKLKPEMSGSAHRELQHILEFKPNLFMDGTKFIARIATYLECEHTCFIVPLEDKYGRLAGFYPLRAAMAELIESGGVLYLRYTFGNGQRACIEFDRVGVLTSHQYKDDLVGENNSTLAPTMQLMHSSNESIINAVKNSADIRFMAKIANILKPEDIKKERERFTEENLSSDNKSGMIIYDNKFTDLKQVESKPYTPNALQIQQIQENVCTHFGVSMDILQNKFNEDTWNAFYEGKIEPFAIQLSIVLSNMIYTAKEFSYGNMLTYSANRLQYASNNTKIQVSSQLFDRGLITRNMVMDIWNLPHVEDGDKYYIRKEYTEITELGDDAKDREPIDDEPQDETEPQDGDESGKEPKQED